MHETLTKTKFINALVREHLGIEEMRKSRDLGTHTEYLRLEVLPGGTTEARVNRLVIRGNRLATLWMILDKEFPYSKDGFSDIHKAAVEIAFSAAQKASEKLGFPVQFGMPPVSYFAAWLQK